MARSLGVHHSTVARIWRDHKLKPHRHTTFKLSRDPNYTAKLVNVVGVYLSPPEHAVVLCVDEKSQIQALDRTQPGLPLKRERASSWTHDYLRNGTTTLFAALEMAKGRATGQCYAKHRHQGFLKFLRHLDAEHNITLDDNVAVILEFGKRCLGYIECSWTSPAGFVGIEILGDKGAICCNYSEGEATIITQKTTAAGTGKATALKLASATDAWGDEMQYFTRALATKKPFTPGLDAGIATQKLIEGAYQSAKAGRKIRL